MRLEEFFTKLWEYIPDASSVVEEMADYEIVTKQKYTHILLENGIKDIICDREQKKIYIWIE